MSYISCSNAVGTLNPWLYIGGPNSIRSGQGITFTLTSYATTMQTTVFTQIYPTVTMETVPASVVVWNVPQMGDSGLMVGADCFGFASGDD